MVRIVKEPEIRRNEILDAAERLLVTKGYEQMAIRDLVDELQIAKGTVYHYFDSKQALLEALIERMVAQIEQRALSIAHDPHLSALEKLLRHFASTDQWKLAHQSLVMQFLRVWYDDENAIVHRKLSRAGVKRFVPLLSQIIRQGVEEGVFTTPYPDQAARMIIALRDDLGTAIAELYLSEGGKSSIVPQITQIVNATSDALERVLGAAPGSLPRTSDEELVPWLFSSASPT
ncbi:TetR family transcriptional regulator [Ktedonobacteria bacterium brp13]|nr:TetR family transcriptional regulator [Ktedonobacteria bacterium brp13]